MLRTQVQTAFNKAIANQENWKNGKVNFDFVNADVYLDIPNSLKMSQEIDQIFNELVDNFLVDTSPEYC